MLNVIRINHNYRPRLSLEWQKLKPLELDAAQTAKIAELAPIVEGNVGNRRRLKAERSPTVWLQNAPFAPTGIGPLPCIPARQTIQ